MVVLTCFNWVAFAKLRAVKTKMLETTNNLPGKSLCVSGWTNPSEKYARQIDFFPQIGWNWDAHKNYLKPAPRNRKRMVNWKGCLFHHPLQNYFKILRYHTLGVFFRTLKPETVHPSTRINFGKFTKGVTLPETNIAPEKGPSQKYSIVFEPSIVRCEQGG